MEDFAGGDLMATKSEWKDGVTELSSALVTQSTQDSFGNDEDESTKFTRVNGIGMWHSWTRNFKSPLLALLDLIDNCLDAALSPHFQGRVHVERSDPVSLEEMEVCGISITNNCFQPARPLVEVLEVYNSKKGKHGDTVGENGVGLKQGCATLSDMSFVLTKSGDSFSLGVIAASMQRMQGVRLPSFTFETEPDMYLDEKQEKIKSEIQQIAENDEAVAECFSRYGGGDLHMGISHLTRHYFCLLKDGWGENCFRVVLTELRHGSGDRLREGAIRSANPANALLAELHEELPKNYIHIPPEFEFLVDERQVMFSYWQRRLVELSSFTALVDPYRSLTEYEHGVDTWKHQGYPLSIYCGFDCQRIAGDGESACVLCIYSRSSGRLIKCVDDARHLLMVNATGIRYCQGLTVIVDDEKGRLPLNPTKQDLAFGEEQNGLTHETNLYSWIGAVAHCFWNFHAEKFELKNSLLREAVAKHLDAVIMEQNIQDRQRPRLSDANLSSFCEIQWRKSRMGARREHTIIRVNKTSAMPFVYRPGDDTLFIIETPSAKMLQRGKRKRIKAQPLFEDDSDEVPAGSNDQSRRKSETGRSPARKGKPGRKKKLAKRTSHEWDGSSLASPHGNAAVAELERQLAIEKQNTKDAEKRLKDSLSQVDAKDKSIEALRVKVRHLNKMMKAMINSQIPVSDSEDETS